jgi:hypothetical protein
MFVLQITCVWTGSSYIYPVIYENIDAAEVNKARLESSTSSTGKIKNNTIKIRELV